MARLKVVDLERYKSTSTGIVGKLRVIYDDDVLFECVTIEQPWLSNAPYESCIPEGLYKMKWGRYNRGGYDCWEIKDVPGRSLIKIHVANTIKNLLGCIGVGDAEGTMQGLIAVLNSKDTLRLFHEVLKDDREVWLSVRNAW